MSVKVACHRGARLRMEFLVRPTFVSTAAYHPAAVLPVTACKQILCHIRPLSEVSYIFRALHVTRVAGFSNARPAFLGPETEDGFSRIENISRALGR